MVAMNLRAAVSLPPIMAVDMRPYAIERRLTQTSLADSVRFAGNERQASPHSAQKTPMVVLASTMTAWTTPRNNFLEVLQRFSAIHGDSVNRRETPNTADNRHSVNGALSPVYTVADIRKMFNYPSENIGEIININNVIQYKYDISKHWRELMNIFSKY